MRVAPSVKGALASLGQPHVADDAQTAVSDSRGNVGRHHLRPVQDLLHYLVVQVVPSRPFDDAADGLDGPPQVFQGGGGAFGAVEALGRPGEAWRPVDAAGGAVVAGERPGRLRGTPGEPGVQVREAVARPALCLGLEGGDDVGWPVARAPPVGEGPDIDAEDGSGVPGVEERVGGRIAVGERNGGGFRRCGWVGGQ